MRRIVMLLAALCLATSAGCSYSDLFGVFGTYYSGGGSDSDRDAQYKSDVDKLDNRP